MIFGKQVDPDDIADEILVEETANVTQENLEFLEVRQALMTLLNDPAITFDKIDVRRRKSGSKYRMIIRASQKVANPAKEQKHD